MPIFLIYLAIVNLVAFFLCGFDKRRALQGGWRVPERVLLLWAALGGSPAFFLGMHLFHHKTRKPKFSIGVPVIFLFQLLLLAAARRFLS